MIPLDSRLVVTPDMAGCVTDHIPPWRNYYECALVAEHFGFTVPEEFRSAFDDYRNAFKEDHFTRLRTSKSGYLKVVGKGGLADMATEYLNGQAPEGYVFHWRCAQLYFDTAEGASRLGGLCTCTFCSRRSDSK